MSGEAEAALRRFERDAVAACVATALVALVVITLAHGLGRGLNACAAVVGGGVLMVFSYRGVKGAVDLLMHTAEAARRPEPSPAEDLQSQEDVSPALRADQDPGPARGRRVVAAVKFFTRYALLALAAYVMLTRLRLHPVGVVAGALAPFLAAAMQVGRLSRARARGPHP